MKNRATGTFEVKLEPQMSPEPIAGVTLGRMSLKKRFSGELEGTSEGEMLTAVTEIRGSAGYVAIERVTATLHGRAGSFVLQHSGTMQGQTQELSITVVPDSGRGALVGLTGQCGIDIKDGQHFYTFDYVLPE